MQTDTNAARLGCDEHEAAALLGLSVHTLRKDRITARRFPFYKIGASVRYNRDRLAQTLAELERGGPPAPQAKPRRAA
jgi:hypothetical protein